MKSLDYNQIKIFINLEIIGEEDKYKKKKKKLQYLFFKNSKTILRKGLDEQFGL